MYSTYQFRENTGHMHKQTLPKAKALFHWILEWWEINGEEKAIPSKSKTLFSF